MARVAAWATFLLLLGAQPVWARTPEIAKDSSNGIWIANGEQFIFQTLDRWSVFTTGGNVNRMLVDGLTLWLATDDGVIRMDIGSRRQIRYGMDEGLPSQRVSTVAMDEQYVWFGTNKGLVRYRRSDQTLKVFDESNGLQNKAITSSITIGRQVWFGSREGLAYFSPDVDGIRTLGEAEGLPEGEILELYQIGDDLWLRQEDGLVRFRIQQRVFTRFPLADLHATQINSLSQDGADFWLGTDNGLFLFQSSSDTFLAWPQQEALKSRNIRGVEVKSDKYLFIATDQEIIQYSKFSKSIKRYTLNEGLTGDTEAVGTLLTDEAFTVIFGGRAELLNIKNDQWLQRDFEQTENKPSSTTARIFGKLDSSMPYDFKLARPKGWTDGLDNNRWANLEGGIGVSHQVGPDRVLNASLRLDYGQLEASGIRDLQYKVEYLGSTNDYLREVRVEDKLSYRYVEEGLERPLLLQGATVRVASKGTDPAVKIKTDIGFRRGQLVRDFITGPRQDAYQLSKKYIIPGSDRVYLDGELLSRDVDYSLLNAAGQLVFLNPERFDDLSVITVEYEYDLVPKKDLGSLSLSAMLPFDNEIGSWVRSGEPRLLSDTGGLFNEIDGAAPKYIERNWQRSIYAGYRQGGRSLQVAIHDMGDDSNAYSIYSRDLPTSRVPVEGLNNAIVDMGLPNAYAVKAYWDQYFLEISVDDRSDASLVFVKAFAKAILDRKKQVTANTGEQFKEWLSSARVAASPAKGLELGARVTNLRQLTDQVRSAFDANGNLVEESLPGRNLLTGTVDGRYQRAVGEGGLLTTYAELAGSNDQNSATPNGYAGMGFLRFSHPSLEGMFSGRVDSRGWTGLGSVDSRLGKQHDELRLNVTGYPAKWMPTTVFFSRQRAYLPDGSGGQGLIQHALARVQINNKDFPATTLQVGATELDNPNVFQIHRVQGSAQVDYDLAQLLTFTGIKRWNVRALYSLSQAETEKYQQYAYGDRVRQIRLETKFAPTFTESLWALFRSRDLARQVDEDGKFWRGFYRWELLSGAQSTIIPGLVPKLNYNVVYEDNRLPSTNTGTNAGGGGTPQARLSSEYSSLIPPGPGFYTPNVPSMVSKGTIGTGVGIYPGQWLSALSALALEPAFSVSAEEQAVDRVKTKKAKTYDLLSLEVYAGHTFELELYQRYWFSQDGQDQQVFQKNLMLRNTVVWRPRPSSPITLAYSYLETKGLNDTAVSAYLVEPVNQWSLSANQEARLEWLNRWSQKHTSRIRLKGTRGLAEDVVNKDVATGELSIYNYTQYVVGMDAELRWFPIEGMNYLYAFQRFGVFRSFGYNTGSKESWYFAPVAGMIYRMGDKLYLEAQVAYDLETCLGGACKPLSRLDPRLTLTVNL